MLESQLTSESYRYLGNSEQKYSSKNVSLLKEGLTEAFNHVKKGLEYHVVDSTAMLLSTNPLFAVSENIVSEMNDPVAIKARAFASLSVYLGTGSLISGGRDLTRKLFRVTDESSEKKQIWCDIGYNMAFNAVFGPIMYTLSGAELPSIIKGTVMAMAMAPAVGPLLGYSVDLARDLTGLKKSERIPKAIKNLSKLGKISLAVGSSATLIGLNGLVYVLSPDKIDTKIENPTPIVQEISPQDSLNYNSAGKLDSLLRKD